MGEGTHKVRVFLEIHEELSLWDHLEWRVFHGDPFVLHRRWGATVGSMNE